MTAATLRRGAVLAVAASAVLAAPAGAANVDLAGGATTLKLDPMAGKALKSLGVTVSPTGKAKAGKSGVAFPVTGGRIDNATAAGTIRHTGGLRLKAGKVSVTLSDFDVKVSKSPSISVKVNGGARLNALRPVLGKAKVTRTAVSTRVSNVAVHLTTPAAKALNRAFKVKAFKPKLKLGTVIIDARLKDVVLTGGQTALALDPGAAAALTSLGVTPALVGAAVANPDGSLGFPVTRGRVNATTLGGTIDHGGGISLTAGATVVRLTDFRIDTKAAQLTAVINGGARAAILDLDLAAPKVTVDGTTITVGNVPGTLTQGAADALNGAFGVTAFTKGLKLGVATVKGES